MIIYNIYIQSLRRRRHRDVVSFRLIFQNVRPYYIYVCTPCGCCIPGPHVDLVLINPCLFFVYTYRIISVTTTRDGCNNNNNNNNNIFPVHPAAGSSPGHPSGVYSDNRDIIMIYLLQQQYIAAEGASAV